MIKIPIIKILKKWFFDNKSNKKLKLFFTSKYQLGIILKQTFFGRSTAQGGRRQIYERKNPS